ncbi:MAG: DUF3303 family protein [Candidatus Rokubacteria bacterium]|nr:DUF3303 family protein [Candidatus Rokubacteria bacterium]
MTPSCPVAPNTSRSSFRASASGRWHCAQGLRGFIVADTSDAEAIAKWLQEWTDLLSFEVTPVVSDEQLGRVIG